MNRVIFKDLGLIDFKEAWDYQKRLFGEVMAAKLQPSGNQHTATPVGYLIFCEHNHVYTLGKSGKEENLLVGPVQLQAKNAAFYYIDRGGDITYHGPGQVVGYPILNLEWFVKGVKEYIFKLEEAVIFTLSSYGIRAGRLEGATGVWIDAGTPAARKICAIGVKTSRWVSMHGFAFNVNTDLDYFRYINPCGFTDKAVTSMQQELGRKMDMDEVKQRLKEGLSHVFRMEILDNS